MDQAARCMGRVIYWRYSHCRYHGVYMNRRVMKLLIPSTSPYQIHKIGDMVPYCTVAVAS